ncbi:MAG: hypothetical protein R3E66_09905 [bacterium]
MSIDRGEGKVEVESEDIDWVELEYRVNLEDATSALQPTVKDGVVYGYGPAFLVLPAQQVLDRTRDVQIELHTPTDWNVVSTWTQVAQKVSSVDPNMTVRAFQATDGQALRDAFLAGGRRLSVDRLLDDLDVAYGPEFRGDRERVGKVIADAVSAYRSDYGHLGPVKVLVRTTAEADRGNLGGLGRRGGFVVELPVDATADSATALLVWHEALHLWNGHFAVPDPRSEAETRWFKEGLTHYLATVAACNHHAITSTFLLEEWARIIDAYERNPLRRRGPGTELDAARFPYDFGAILGVKLDAQARGQTSQRWLQQVLDTRGADAYEPRMLREALMKVYPAGSSLWLNISQRQDLEAAALFESIGLHFLRGSDREPRLVWVDGNARFAEIFGGCSVNAQ